MEAPRFTCVVCNEQFTDPYQHYQDKKEDQKHIDYADKLRAEHYTIPCFCDGTIASITVGEGWEIYCTDCLMVFDED